MNNIFDDIKKLKIVPVIAIEDAKDARNLAQALIEGGLPVAEVTFRTSAAEESIRIMSENFPNMLIGAGTVLTTEQVDRAINAGAKFIVSPGLNPEVVKYCVDRDIAIIPGCATPSDIEQAIALGLSVVKFFPAEAAGGIKMIKAMSAPYSGIRFMPTGGINAGNINDYLSFDKVIACGGSWMVKSSMIKAGEFDKIKALTKEAVEKVTPFEDNVPVEIYKGECKGNKVITFGEIMLRLAPQGYYRFVQAENYGATYGGGEANVSISLANFGLDTAFVTKLPSHEIGQAAVNSLRKYGVDTSMITRGGERVGIYFLEKGASQRPSKVIYDRAGSAIAKASKDDFDWNKIFEDAKWFHFTGITPALSDNMAEICLDAVKAAKARGITVSCDLNYRNKLWSKEKAGKVMGELCKYVDVCIANEEDASDVFGIKADDTDVTTGKVNHEGYKAVAKKLADRFGFKKVAITLRGSVSANDNNWAAMLYDGNDYYFSKKYLIHIVDRVGGGDSFGAGLIYSCINDFGPQETIEFAVAASCLKHSIEGDFNMVSVPEVLKLAGGDGSGRVQR